jgi:hypothetical protein
MVFFWEIHVFQQFTWIGLFGTKCAFLPIENPVVQAVFLSKLTQFSLGHNVLYAPLYNIHGFLLRGACVSSTQLNRDTCVSSIQLIRSHLNKVRFTPPWNPDWQATFLSKTNVIVTGKQGARCSCFLDGFILTDTCVSSTQLSSAIWN